MSPLAEAARARLSRRLSVAVVLLGSAGLSACTSYRFDREPVSAATATAASAPVVVVASPPVPVVDAASAPVAVTVVPVDPVLPGDLASRRLLAHHDLVRTLPPNELAQEINRLAALPTAPESSLNIWIERLR